MYTPYQPRPVKFLGVEALAGYQLKVYAIHHADRVFERERFAGGWALAAQALPTPATTGVPQGAGFAVLHQARTCDYLILCWWDRENELPTRIFIKDSDGWRPKTRGESFCVWDLRVVWHEREAYVATVLSGGDDGLETYLTRVLEGHA